MLRDEIVPYTDGDGLISCSYNPTHSYRSCDNGVCFTSEYYILLLKNNELVPQDITDYTQKIKACMTAPGLVCRSPGDTGEEEPDDYHGIFAACRQIGAFDMGKQILSYGLKHFGSYNCPNPNHFSWSSMIFRMPQLIAAAYSAADDVHFWQFPVFGYAALVIEASCVGTPVTDTDSRRLAWLLIQALAPVSKICRIAAKRWTERLLSDYGQDGMRSVSRIYYGKHPFSKYHQNVAQIYADLENWDKNKHEQ